MGERNEYWPSLLVAWIIGSLSCVDNHRGQTDYPRLPNSRRWAATCRSSSPTELGLFAAENLEVKTVFIQGGPTAMAALIGGDVDYVKVAGIPAARAIAQGTPLVIAGGFQPYHRLHVDRLQKNYQL